MSLTSTKVRNTGKILRWMRRGSGETVVIRLKQENCRDWTVCSDSRWRERFPLGMKSYRKVSPGGSTWRVSGWMTFIKGSNTKSQWWLLPTVSLRRTEVYWCMVRVGRHMVHEGSPILHSSPFPPLRHLHRCTVRLGTTTLEHEKSGRLRESIYNIKVIHYLTTMISYQPSYQGWSTTPVFTINSIIV